MLRSQREKREKQANLYPAALLLWPTSEIGPRRELQVRGIDAADWHRDTGVVSHTPRSQKSS